MSDEQTFTIKHSGLREPLTFAGKAPLVKFLDRERDAWNEWREKIERAKVPVTFLSYVSWDPASTAWRSIAAQAPANPVEAVRISNEQLGSRAVLYSKSPLGALLMAIVEQAPELSALLLAIYTSQRFGEGLRNANTVQIYGLWTIFLSGLPQIIGTVSARKFTEDARIASVRSEEQAGRIADLANATEQIVTNRRGDLTHLVALGRRVVMRSVRNGRRAAEAQANRIDAEWKEMKARFALKMQTRAPYTYWRQKQMNHRKVAQAWMRSFTWSLLLGFLGTGIGAIVLISIGPGKEPWPWLLPAVCLGVPAFVSLWVARLSNRQFSANILRAEDAGERAVMVRTLLAMSEENTRVAGEAEFLTMIAALFRPGPGLATEDSPAVGALDAALKVLQGRGDSR